MSLTAKIADVIRKNGPISFKEYMKAALYDDEFGYYSRSRFPAGRHGDFITSPHTCRLFGAVIANQILEFRNYTVSSGDSTFTIVEMGAGSGYLARDIIRYFKETLIDMTGYEYVIVEPCNNTAALQKKTLGELQHMVRWVSSLSELGDIKGCLISNELLDAFPVNVVEKEEDGFKELYVDFTEDSGFSEVLKPLSGDFLKQYCNMLPEQLPVPYRTEINTGIKEWISDTASILSSGFVLTIDYGYTWDEYFMPHRNRGTVLGYHSQNVIDDVLQHPGLIDITAHVNFSDLSRYGLQYGFETIGYTSQYAFLGGLDFENTFRNIYGRIDPFSPEMAAVKMLIMPQAMGESHKVMIQSKGLDTSQIELSGFRFSNHMKAL